MERGHSKQRKRTPLQQESARMAMLGTVTTGTATLGTNIRRHLRTEMATRSTVRNSFAWLLRA